MKEGQLAKNGCYTTFIFVIYQLPSLTKSSQPPSLTPIPPLLVWWHLILSTLDCAQTIPNKQLLNTHPTGYPRLALKYLAQPWTMIHSNNLDTSTHPPVTEKHPHAFFKHKAVKFLYFFGKVFRLYAVGLHEKYFIKIQVVLGLPLTVLSHEKSTLTCIPN